MLTKGVLNVIKPEHQWPSICKRFRVQISSTSLLNIRWIWYDAGFPRVEYTWHCSAPFRLQHVLFYHLASLCNVYADQITSKNKLLKKNFLESPSLGKGLWQNVDRIELESDCLKFPPKLVTWLPRINMAEKEVSWIVLHYFSGSFPFLPTFKVVLLFLEHIWMQWIVVNKQIVS